MTKPKKLSEAQLRMLESARDHGSPYHHIHGQGLSVHGGAWGTWVSLLRRGYLADKTNKITTAGRAVLKENRR